MDIKQTFEKLKSAFTSDKKLAVLCAVGVLGVLLLVISTNLIAGRTPEVTIVVLPYGFVLTTQIKDRL